MSCDPDTLSAPGETPVYLLAAGLSPPLDSYIVAKLEGLAARGLRVEAAIAGPTGEIASELKGVEVIDQPPLDEPPIRIVGGLVRDGVRLALRSPRSLVGAIRAARRPLGPSRGGVLAFAKRLRAYLPLAALRPDVVHFEWNSAAILYGPMANVWRCPTAVSCHGSEVNVRPHLPGGVPFARALATSFADATAVHCVSNSVSREATLLGADPRRTWIIRPGVDITPFHPPRGRTSATTLRIATVGQLRWLKGHEYALRAIRHMTDWDIPTTLDLIGGEPAVALAEESDRSRLERAVKELGLTGCVRLHGRLAHDEVRSALAQADVLLHMSVSEGLGVAVLEAMACGLPVVVADAGGPTEVVSDGVHGFVVPARDPLAAARALRALYDDFGMRERMGAAARRAVETQFTLDRELDAFVALYSELTARTELAARVPPASARRDAVHPRPGVVSPARELRLLSIGPWDWMERYDAAMAAVSLLLDNGVRCHYRIVGAGPCRDALWFERHQLELERHVDILEEIAPWDAQIDWADVLIDTGAPCDAVDLARRHGVAVLSAPEGKALAMDVRNRLSLDAPVAAG